MSLGLFLYPRFSEGTKFYFIPFRFYELAAGGLAGLYAKRLSKKEVFNNRWLAPLAFLLLLAALNIGIIRFDIHQIGVHTAIIGENVVQKNALLLPNQALVIIVVLLSCLYLLTGAQYHISGGGKILTAIGKRSYSIFIWHQVLLALYRYSFSNKLSIGFVAGFFAVLAGISEISYRFAEQSIGITKKSVLCTGLCAVLICGMSGMIYLHAGVVRDVPELGIKKTEVHRNMHAQYCDRVFQYDHDYTEDQKTKVLIIGNSFARDFGNILLESEYADDVDISYASNYSEDLAERIRQADRIFIFGDKNNVPDYLWESVSDVDKVYGIGTKNFGLTNGNIYAHRFSKTYFDQTVSLDPGYKALDDRWKREWGDHYVAMIDPVLKDSNVRVFTDDHMYISQDCAHLTQGGARYYARILDLKSLLF